MRFSSEVTPNRGDSRTKRKFAWLPVKLGEVRDGLWKFSGVKVWLETYEQHEVWWDHYYDSRYEWRVVARLLPAVEVKAQKDPLAPSVEGK